MANFESLITLTQVADGGEYRVETNQEEILKFRNNDIQGWNFSPPVLKFIPYKKNEHYFDENGTDFKIIIYSDNDDKKEFSVSTKIKTLGDEEISLSEIDIVNQSYNVNLTKLNLIASTQLAEDNQPLQDWLKELLDKDSFVIGLFYKKESVFQRLIPCRNGMNIDMATFALETNKIVQAIQSTSLEFTSSGLTLKNGAFTIIDENNKELLGTENGNLSITGIIYATDGKFTGTIEAKNGSIGGFTIENNRLISASGALVLNGVDSIIKAQNIELGIGAKIENYLQLGKAFLYNPTANNEWKVLSAGNFSLFQDGYLNLGNIEMYGGGFSEENEYTEPYIKTNSWKISGDGKAEFKDLYADNVHLLNTLMEIGTVQNVGSLMIFKDAWAPIKIENKKLFFDEIVSLEKGDWIYNGKNYYKVEEVEKVEGVEKDRSTITLHTTYTEPIEIPISKFGKNKTSEDPGFVFSAFGESEDSTSTELSYPFASPYSITLSSFTENNNRLNFTKNLILGKLKGAIRDENQLKGIGLYCDNVYLKGSLTAENNIDSNTTYYSGINTLSEIDMPKFIKDDEGNDVAPYFPSETNPTESSNTGKILLWAGAKSVNGIVDIANSPFRVDSYGNFYAGSGYFEGSIISKATITAAIMEAARIRTAILEGVGGDEQTNQAALKIINTEKCIGFGDEITVNGSSQYNEIFSINKTGFNANKVDFIKIDQKNGISTKISSAIDGMRKEFVSEFATDSEGKKTLQLKVLNIDTENIETKEYNFSIDDNLNIKKGDSNIATINLDNSIYNTNMTFNNHIYYSNIMRYEKIKNVGYDLYIEDKQSNA